MLKVLAVYFGSDCLLGHCDEGKKSVASCGACVAMVVGTSSWWPARNAHSEILFLFLPLVQVFIQSTPQKREETWDSHAHPGLL